MALLVLVVILVVRLLLLDRFLDVLGVLRVLACRLGFGVAIAVLVSSVVVVVILVMTVVGLCRWASVKMAVIATQMTVMPMVFRTR